MLLNFIASIVVHFFEKLPMTLAACLFAWSFWKFFYVMPNFWDALWMAMNIAGFVPAAIDYARKKPD